MNKLICVLPMIFAAVSAGYLNAAPLAYSGYAGYAAPAVSYQAPLAVAHAPIAVAHAPAIVKTAVPVATSYANTYKVDVKSAQVAVAAPVAYAAPTVVKTIAAAPLAYHAPAQLAYHAPAPLAYHAPAPLAYHAPQLAYSAPAIVKSPLVAASPYGYAAGPAIGLSGYYH